MRKLATAVVAFLGCVLMSMAAQAQQAPPPGPPPSCEQQLNGEMFEAGEAYKAVGLLKQQLAGARERVRVLSKQLEDRQIEDAKKAKPEDAKKAKPKE